MELNHEYCVYFSQNNYEILDFLPQNISNKTKSRIIQAWNVPICRQVMLFLSDKSRVPVSEIKSGVGHSLSTLHETLDKLEDLGLVKSEMIYEGKKQKLITPRVLFVTRNSRFKRIMKEALNQGLWVDSDRTNQIISVLDKNPQKYFSLEELSVKTGIPVDEIKVLLDNFDSQITRALSDFMKRRPFEKKTLYRSTRP